MWCNGFIPSATNQRAVTHKLDTSKVHMRTGGADDGDGGEDNDDDGHCGDDAHDGDESL